jgi:hypothetical protein
MGEVEEKLVRYDGVWHIAALDRFSWPAVRYERLPGAAKVSGTNVEFLAWGDREGHLVCLPGQEEDITDLPK